MVTGLVQARSTSSRFPGKMLKAFGSTTVLGSVLSRVKESLSVDDIVVLTSTEESDDALCDVARSLGVGVYRGSMENVASRFYEYLTSESTEAFVRISGDSPLIDPELIDQGVELFHQSEADLATNVLSRTFPMGQSVEVVRSESFKRSFPLFGEKHVEHVTTFFYENPERFKIASFESEDDCSDVRLSIDFQHDYEVLSNLLQEDSGKLRWKQLARDWRREVSGGKA